MLCNISTNVKSLLKNNTELPHWPKLSKSLRRKIKSFTPSIVPAWLMLIKLSSKCSAYGVGFTRKIIPE